jgi:phosphoserine aminotransferase
MVDRVFNFSAGPAVLPLPVLEQVQREIIALPGVGMSVMEISHRSSTFADILKSAEQRLRQLLKVPDHYRILFLQGGARLQFSMVPMNLMTESNSTADYMVTGSWGKKALAEAEREGTVRRVWDGKQTGYDRVPDTGQLDFDPRAAYVHITSNETIEGVQFPAPPDTGQIPLVCDASSDFLSRPVPVDRYGLIYACAQKNAGPAGITIVIIREDLLQRSREHLAGYLNYRLHAENDSCFNTPTTFAIYVVNLVAGWLLDEIGGLESLHELNRRKAELLYEVIDESNRFYAGHAHPESRSIMNVTFRLPGDDVQKEFLAGAEKQGLCNLKGHRSVGGIRASIYNAMPLSGVESLRDYMRQFLAQHGR